MWKREEEYLPFEGHQQSAASVFTGKVKYKWDTPYNQSYGYELYKNGKAYGLSLNFDDPDKVHVCCLAGSYSVGYSIWIEKSEVVQFDFIDRHQVIERIETLEGKTNTRTYIDLNESDLDYKKLLEANRPIVEVILKEKALDKYECAYHNHFETDTSAWDYDHYKKLGYQGDRKTFFDNFSKVLWAMRKQEHPKDEFYGEREAFLKYYALQKEMQKRIIRQDVLPDTIKYIAGVDVAYNEMEQVMVGAIVILDADTMAIVDQAHHKMDITFPYIPGLFSFREIPPIRQAFKQLNIQPDLIICDAQGIAHPKNVGMATHLGIELDIPTIGCAKKRLVGTYDPEKLGDKRADSTPLIWNSEVVGVALRTQSNINPLFVSIGHKISLSTAIRWVLKLTPDYRLPETTRQADQLVNKILKARTDQDFLNDHKNGKS